MIFIRSFGVAWLLQSMELSLHTVEVVSISIREALLPATLSISVITFNCSLFSRFSAISPFLSPNPLCLA
jgi:hypothetical protein